MEDPALSARHPRPITLPLADKVVTGRMTEADIVDLGLSDDDVFDLILSAALDAAHAQQRLGLALIKTIS